MKIINRVVLTAVAGLGIAIGVAAPASAEAVKFNATPGQLETACKKVGGDYHHSQESFNYYCITKTGVAGCNMQGDCTYTPSATKPRPGTQTFPQVVATVGVAG